MSDRVASTVFVERLLRLPLVAWYEAANCSAHELDAVTRHTFLEVLRRPELAWDAWCVRDDVEATFWRFECPEGRQLLRPRGEREHVRAVSDRAALAVLVHDIIPASDFGRCYGGFSNCIATDELYQTCS